MDQGFRLDDFVAVNLKTTIQATELVRSRQRLIAHQLGREGDRVLVAGDEVSAILTSQDFRLEKVRLVQHQPINLAEATIADDRGGITRQVRHTQLGVEDQVAHPERHDHAAVGLGNILFVEYRADRGQELDDRCAVHAQRAGSRTEVESAGLAASVRATVGRSRVSVHVRENVAINRDLHLLRAVIEERIREDNIGLLVINDIDHETVIFALVDVQLGRRGRGNFIRQGFALGVIVDRDARTGTDDNFITHVRDLALVVGVGDGGNDRGVVVLGHHQLRVQGRNERNVAVRILRVSCCGR